MERASGPAAGQARVYAAQGARAMLRPRARAAGGWSNPARLGEGEADVLPPLPARKQERGHQLARVAGKGRHAERHVEGRDAGGLRQP